MHFCAQGTYLLILDWLCLDQVINNNKTGKDFIPENTMPINAMQYDTKDAEISNPEQYWTILSTSKQIIENASSF